STFILADAAAAENYTLSLHDALPILAKVVAARGIAAFYFGQGPQRDFARARQYFEQAIDLLKHPTDAYSLYTLGYTYETWGLVRSEEHTSELQSRENLVCRLLFEKKK